MWVELQETFVFGVFVRISCNAALSSIVRSSNKSNKFGLDSNSSNELIVDLLLVSFEHLKERKTNEKSKNYNKFT